MYLSMRMAPSPNQKQVHLLSLFEKMTALTRERIPPEERDPRLLGVGVLPRGSLFSCFHEKHLKEANKLFEILYAAQSYGDFLDLAHKARDIVNEGIFIYALSVAVIHRDDCKGLILPPIQEVFPDRFIPAETINAAFKQVKKNDNEGAAYVDIQTTGNILDPEYKLAYFREDMGVNAHHWFWHVVYPANWNEKITGKIKPRRGELFFYMHQQMCARYDCERLSNGLNRMIPFHNFEEPLEGYAPHLTSLVSGLHYASRPNGFSLRDLPDVDVQDMERWRERILEAIDLGRVLGEENGEIPLTEANGVDILGAIIEASSGSPNKGYYGSLHNWGHVMMARMHDPDGRFQENPGVLSDTSTSLRDPLFYRWHRFVDDIFQQYKATLKPYTKEQLSFPGVRLVSAEVTSLQSETTNLISTFMSIKQTELDLSHGINFGTDDKVMVIYKHLVHEEYAISLEVENISGETKYATVRVFLGPKFDELGNRLTLNDQRRLFIELDKFHKQLEPGRNKIIRYDSDSSVTLSRTYTFDELRAGAHVSEDTSEYCNCGWPAHMLLPKGTHKGMDYELFIMLTDYTQDKPDGNDAKTMCNDAFSYCGAKDQQYPDKKPMGFPFDKLFTAKFTEDLLTENMVLVPFKIQYLD